MNDGVYPAAVTPFTALGEVDFISLARLLAFFEAAGCAGVVLGGTNGEGPSLSAIERRDLLKGATPLRGKLELVIGIASSSLSEAIWLAEQAGKHGAAALLVMPPSYFRAVPETAILSWFLALLEASPLPVLLYNYPKMTGVPITAAMLGELRDHPKLLGAKDSSGEVANLQVFREALKPQHKMFVGDERLLISALEDGWNGTISGCANVLPQWLVQVFKEVGTESGLTKFQLILPLLERLRSYPQPALNKAILYEWGVLETPNVRLPLTNADPKEMLAEIEAVTGIRKGNLGLSSRME